MHFVAVEAAEIEGETRLANAMDEYSSKYKKLSWLRRWSTGVKADKAQRWLNEWLGKRKAPKSEAPQVMEVPQKSGAGSEDDPHRQKYEDEDFYEAGEDGTGDSGGGASEGSEKQSASHRVQMEQCTCRCQGPDGQHRCEAAAAENGRCELCLLGCAPGEGIRSDEGYRRCTCATAECTGCTCGCECVGCISSKRLHAAANRDVLQGDHWEHGERYAREHRHSRQPCRVTCWFTECWW